MTLGDLINRAKTLAESTAISEADFLYVLQSIVKLSRTELVLDANTILSDNTIDDVLSCFSRLTAGEPPQYITGQACFYGIELFVAPGVLIPRPETEGLVELISSRIVAGDSILDVGTGSGAIAIALKSLCPGCMLDAIDISEPALEIAQKNAQNNDVDVAFHHGDLFPDNGKKYDVIASNPPYITATEMEQLSRRVKDYEPWNALFGGEDGLDYYRTMILQAKQHLSSKGFLAFEHGALQQRDIIALARNMGWSKVEPYPDLQGRDRYLLIYQ